MPSVRTVKRAALAALAVMAAAGSALAYPKPSPTPPRWELEFEPGDLRLYQDEATGEVYWYFTYMLTNRTGRERIWAPSFTLFTDAGEILPSGRDVPTRVADDLHELLGNRFLESQNEIIGEIFFGREHAREGLVVWRARNLEVNELSMFIAGLSSDTARLEHPVTGQEIVLRKTLQRDYLLPGDLLPHGSKPVELVAERWVMR